MKSSELSISWDAPITEIGGDSDLVERYEGQGGFEIIPSYTIYYPSASIDGHGIFRSEVLSTLRRRHQRNRHPNLGTVGDVQGPETIHGLRDTGSGENYARLGRVHTGRVQEDASRYGTR